MPQAQVSLDVYHELVYRCLSCGFCMNTDAQARTHRHRHRPRAEQVRLGVLVPPHGAGFDPGLLVVQGALLRAH